MTLGGQGAQAPFSGQQVAAILMDDRKWVFLDLIMATPI
jgi:hypothetical protein